MAKKNWNFGLVAHPRNVNNYSNSFFDVVGIVLIIVLIESSISQRAPINATDGLRVVTRIPAGVKDDAAIGRHEVDAQ